MTPVRLGAVEYLNARPLVFRLDRSPLFAVRFDRPARCAALLHDGAVDLGLIPSIEYLRPPDSARGRAAYHIVPDLAVASRGPVASVALFTTKPMTEVTSIALDTSSRTSVALTHVLAQRVFRIQPVLRPHGPDLATMLEDNDAALIIGDVALLLETGSMQVGERCVHVEKVDLGELWTSETGLPFVYAFWAGRAGVVDEAGVKTLQRARDLALGQPETVAAEYFEDQPEHRPLGARYLRDNIKYHLGPEECAGLERFYRYAAEAGLVAAVEPIRFFGLR